MKAIKTSSLLILLVLSFLLAVDYSSAKPLKSQISILRDCRLYTESYDGISCRNASFNDIPICTSDEEIITSPKRGKLCCCIRVKDDEIEEVKEGEIPSSGGDCRDVGCINPDFPNAKSIFCSDSKIPLLFDGGTVTCCCAKDKATKCQIIGCSEPGPGKSGKSGELFCKESLSESTITREAEGEFSKSSCCCPSDIDLSNFTCSLFLGCDLAVNGTKGECPTDSRNFSTKLDIGNDGKVESTIPCCCESVTKPLPKPP